jgi:hypothetical protein
MKTMEITSFIPARLDTTKERGERHRQSDRMQNRGWRSDREPRRSDRPQNRGWRSNHEPRRSDRPRNRGWRSDRVPRRSNRSRNRGRQSDRPTLHSSSIAYFTNLDRLPCTARNFECPPHGAHDSGRITCSSGIPAIPAALLTSPSGYAGATGTAST